jgi:hypothetical protein
MDKSQFESRLRAGVGGKDLWDIRRYTALKTGAAFAVTGKSLSDRVDLKSATGDDLRAMGFLLQMAGELVFAASGMLSGDQHYAGSALVRQVVEIEYLTWTFKEGHASVNAWYNSTHKERMEVFAPRQLRENAKGRFLSKDYADHCEQGGHPTPRGIHFLGGKNPGGAQVMLVDLLTHSWRTWDQVFVWLLRFVETNIIKMPRTALAIKPRLGKWGEHDPLYALMVETYPEPNR